MALSCASPGADWNLAPFYSRVTAPNQQRVESLGGILRFAQDGETTRWACNPLLWKETRPDGSSEMDFLFPFGRQEDNPNRMRTSTRVWPIYWREKERRPDGVTEIDWALYPFFIGGSADDGSESSLAIFPLGGHLENWLTFDTVDFVLFPFWARTKKDGTTAQHFLFPFFSQKTGATEGWSLFPFFGWSESPGRSKKRFILWPFFIASETELHKKEPLYSWFLFPLYGKREQGDYTAQTLLWPFFGWANRPSTQFNSYQFWPLLKVESATMPQERKLRRILPFFLSYQDKQTEYTSLLWPIFWKREDHLDSIERQSWHALPLFSHTRTQHADGLKERRTRIFPFLSWHTFSDGRHQAATPSLGAVVSRNLIYPVSLWQSKGNPAQRTSEKRAFLGLYQELESKGHRRRTVPFLGGTWEEPNGVVHHAWLAGLLRWTTGHGLNIEAPAFPGPGWPDLSTLKEELP